MTRPSDSVLQELEQIRMAHPEGVLLPAKVVEFAKEHPNSALHGKFEWDDSTAAQQQRMETARGIIRFFKIILDDKRPAPTQRFVSIRKDWRQGGGYRPVAELLNAEDTRLALLSDAFQAMKYFMRKYSILQELSGVINAMQEVVGSERAVS